MNQGGNAAVEHSAPFVMPSSSLSTGNLTALDGNHGNQMDIDDGQNDEPPITNTSPSTVTKIHERNDLPSLTASNLFTAEPTGDLNDDLRKQNETEMLVTGMATATNLKNLLLVSPFDKRNRRLVQSLLEFFKLTVHSRFTSLLIDEHNSSGGFGQASKHSSEKAVKTGKTLKNVGAVSASGKPPIKPQDIIPFPENIIPRLQEDDIMKLSLNVNDLVPRIENDKWNAQYHDLSCPYNSLVISLMACKKFVIYLASTPEIEKKPLHFVLLWIMKKIAFSKETYLINDTGFKEALDSQPHMDYYYSRFSKQRDIGEVLCHVQKVLSIESGLIGIVDAAVTAVSASEKSALDLAIANKHKEYAGENAIRSLFTFVQLISRVCNNCKDCRYFLSPQMVFNLYIGNIRESTTGHMFNGIMCHTLSQLIVDSEKSIVAEESCVVCKMTKGAASTSTTTTTTTTTTTVTEKIVTYPEILVVSVTRALQGSVVPTGSKAKMLTDRYDGSIIPDENLKLGGDNYHFVSAIRHDGVGGVDGGNGHLRAATSFSGKCYDFDDIGSTCKPYNIKDGNGPIVQDSKGNVFFVYEKDMTETGMTSMMRGTAAVRLTSPSSSSTAAAAADAPALLSLPQSSSSLPSSNSGSGGSQQDHQQRQQKQGICAHLFLLADKSQEEERFSYQNQKQPAQDLSDTLVDNIFISSSAAALQIQPSTNVVTTVPSTIASLSSSLSSSTTTASLSSTQLVSTVPTLGTVTTALPQTSTSDFVIETSHLGMKRQSNTPLSTTNGGVDGKPVHTTRRQR